MLEARHIALPVCMRGVPCASPTPLLRTWWPSLWRCGRICAGGFCLCSRGPRPTQVPERKLGDHQICSSFTEADFMSVLLLLALEIAEHLLFLLSCGFLAHFPAPFEDGRSESQLTSQSSPFAGPSWPLVSGSPALQSSSPQWDEMTGRCAGPSHHLLPLGAHSPPRSTQRGQEILILIPAWGGGAR